MRKLVVVLVGAAVVASGLPLRAQDQHTHRHYLLRAAPTDIDAIASRHSLLIERSDEGPPAMYVAASDQDPAVLKAEMIQDTAVLAFEEEQALSLPESGLPSLPTTPPAAAPETSTTEPGVEAAPVVAAPTAAASSSEPSAPTPSAEPTPAPAPDPTSPAPEPVPVPAPETAPAPAPETTPAPLPETLPPTPTEKQAPTAEPTPGSAATPAVQPRALPDTTLTSYYNHDVWRGYVLQPAMANIRAADAHREFGTGVGVVAIIDSGIDLQHPAIAGTFVPGFDFRTNQPTIISDIAALSQSTAVILEAVGTPDPDSLTVAQVNQSTAVILEQSTAVILESQFLPDGVGHGTMVAGLVRLVAPTAKIMPLTVFGADGKGDLYDVVRAIYYAVDHGATVVNMSFSLEQWSKELVRALNYAAEHNVVCVASAGNGGQETMVFPAGFRGVISVGSTDSQNHRSLFSNYGKAAVRLFAPGEGLVTSFPGNRYALVSGTSFSTALVSGAAALVLDRNNTLVPEDVDLSLARVRRIRSETGATADPQMRLDLFYVLSRVHGADDREDD